MELWDRKKKILTAFLAFLGAMALLTLISRAVYASQLPQIRTKNPERKKISYRVQAEGIVKPEREYAVNTLPGIRCRTVYVHPGDRIHPETLLFEADTEDLQELILQRELEIEKLTENMQSLQETAESAEERRRRQISWAEEDYQRICGEGDRAVSGAQDALQKAESELKEAQGEYEDHLANQPKEPEVKPEDAGEATEETFAQQKADWEAKKAELEQKLAHAGEAAAAAENALEDARSDRDNALREAKRGLAEAEAAPQADGVPETNEKEISLLQKQLDEYRALLKAEGKVYAGEEAVVTGVNVAAGERTGDTAAIVYARIDGPLQFCVTLTKEQKKYVHVKDRAKVIVEGVETDASVGNARQNEANPELYDVTVLLPEETASVNQTGSFEIEKQSETYSCVIPLEALKEDETGRKYVYVLSERPGILGTEMAAERVYVRLLDENGSYAALEEGVVDGDTELIVDSDKELKDGMIVRYKE